MSSDRLQPAVGSAHPSGDAVEKPAWAGEGNREPLPNSKNLSDEPPQDRLSLHDPVGSRTDPEWDLAELDDPGEEHPPVWADRQ